MSKKKKRKKITKKNNKKNVKEIEKMNEKNDNASDKNENQSLCDMKKISSEKELKKQNKQLEKIYKLEKGIQKSYEEISKIIESNKIYSQNLDINTFEEKEKQLKLQEIEINYQKKMLKFKSFDFAKWLSTRILLSILFVVLIICFSFTFYYIKTSEQQEILVKCECESCKHDFIDNHTTVYTYPQNQKGEDDE